MAWLKHIWHAYSRFIATEFALCWFRTDLVHCGHINCRSINWNSIRHFGHSWLFCWALTKTSVFCRGTDNDWWSGVITGNIERQMVLHDIERALFSCDLVSRYRPMNFSCACKILQPNHSAEICMPGYLLHENVITLLLCYNRFHGIWCIGSLKHAFAWKLLEIMCLILKEKTFMLKKKGKIFTFTIVEHLWIEYLMKQL